VRLPATAALVATFFVAGALAQRPWHAEAALWEYAVRVEPKAIRGQMNLSFALAAQGRLEEAAWHRLLAAWINDRYPAPVSWGPVEQLEQDDDPLSRIAAAPSRLQPSDPCRLVSGVLGVYRRTLPQFEHQAGQLYAQRHPECFAGAGQGRAGAGTRSPAPGR
jgi:hypothetical protein